MQLETNRVTAGIPGLTPGLRSQRDTVEQTRDQSNRALQQQYQNDLACLAPDGDVDITDAAAQMGRPLMTLDFLAKLKLLNPGIGHEPSLHDPANRWVLFFDKWVRNEALGWVEERTYIGIEYPIMPEFTQALWKWESMANPDGSAEWKKFKKFTDQFRGWRKPLERLIKYGVIEQTRTEQLFQISLGRSSEKWQALTT